MARPLETVAELSRALGDGAARPSELVGRALARAEAVDPALHALLHVRAEAAQREAAEADARRAAGQARSPLDGIPIVVKDNISQNGDPAGCASRILEGYHAPYDATVIERSNAAGLVVVGRANMDEFAMGSSTEHSAYGATRNPWDVERAPGGSSGGSAVAVAAGIVPAALGSDTGGSIRQPASFTGVVGLKPTYGRVSRYGLIAYASSLDQIGPFARTAEDCALVLDAISGHDPRDSTSLGEAPTEIAAGLAGAGAEGLRIGLPREAFESDGANPAVLASVRETVAALEAAGAKVSEVSLPHMRQAIAVYYLIATAEASSNLARFDGVRYGHRAPDPEGLTDLYERSRSEGFGPEVKLRILLGTYVLSAGYYDAYYRKAQQVRTLLRRDFDAAFETCDVVVTPTAPETAFRFGEKSDDPVHMYLSDVYTVPANLAGLPAISVPCGFVSGLPVGLQAIGRPGDDAGVLRAAAAVQTQTDAHTQRPPEPA